MTIQIFGTQKCRDTQKTLRFFKERRIAIHFVDLREKNISRGELTGIARSVPIERLIDTAGKEYEKRNLKYLRHNVEEMLLEYPLLFRTPIVRSAGRATVGYEPEIWLEWLKQ